MQIKEGDHGRYVYISERGLFLLFIGRSPLLRRNDRRECIRSRARLGVVAHEEGKLSYRLHKREFLSFYVMRHSANAAC